MILPGDVTLPENFTLDDLDQLQIINEDSRQKTVAVRVGLTCSFYMRDPLSRDVRLAIAQCADHYQQLAGEHIKCFLNPNSGKEASPEPYPKGGVSLTKYIQQQENTEAELFCSSFYGDDNPYVAAPYGLSIFASGNTPPLNKNPAYFHAVFPFSWLKGKDGEGAFQALMWQWCKILKPFHGYAGVGTILSMVPHEVDRSIHLIYPLARRFPGIDIDVPGSVASKMAKGGGPLKIKGVNWLTALDDQSFEQLGGRDAVLAELGEGFRFYEYDGGCLIQAGSMPQMGDVNQQHTPRYYQQLARKLKPIRMTFPKGHRLIKSPNRQEQTNAEASNQWLARFD